MDYVPKNDESLLVFSQNFRDVMTANATALHLPSSTVTGYTTLHDTYATALAVARAPSTRSPSTIMAKTDARILLVRELRRVAQVVQADTSVSHELKVELGLRPRGVFPPAPPIVPELAPIVTVDQVVGRNVRLRVRDASRPDSRSKPVNTVGAQVYVFCGDVPPPAGDDRWVYMGMASRSLVNLALPATVSGTTPVWFVAQWLTRRGFISPACAPLQTFLQAGPPMTSESGSSTPTTTTTTTTGPSGPTLADAA